MQQDATALSVLALLPGLLDETRPGMLSQLLCTSRSLHDRLLQPGSCRKLVVMMNSTEDAGFLASWLRTYGSMLQALEVVVNNRSVARATCGAAANRFVVAGLRCIPDSRLRALSVRYLELPPSLFKAPSLRGLEELHLVQSGGKSLNHLTNLTNLTSLTIGDSLEERTSLFIPGLISLNERRHGPEPSAAIRLPVSLRSLDAIGLKDAEGGVAATMVSHLTNLTRLRYRGGIGECPALPAAPCMKALRIDHCGRINDTSLDKVLTHMRGLESLYLSAQVGSDKVLKLCQGLPKLEWLFACHVKSFEDVEALACATGLQALRLLRCSSSPAALQPLSCLTRLTSLSLCSWRPLIPSSFNCMYTAGLSVIGHALPHLVRLSLHDHAVDIGLQLEALGLLLDPNVLPALKVLMVPWPWLQALAGPSDGTPAASDLNLPEASRKLLAALHGVRPALVVNRHPQCLQLVRYYNTPWIDASTPLPHDRLLKTHMVL